VWDGVSLPFDNFGEGGTAIAKAPGMGRMTISGSAAFEESIRLLSFIFGFAPVA
jgi:hypothetical protein